MFFPFKIFSGAANSSQLEIAVAASVPFQNGFAEAVAEKSEIKTDGRFGFIGQIIRGSVVISNGETVLKNQKFYCEAVRPDGEIIRARQGGIGGRETGEFSFQLTRGMIGKNEIRCRIDGYPEKIYLNQKARFFVWPFASGAEKKIENYNVSRKMRLAAGNIFASVNFII